MSLRELWNYAHTQVPPCGSLNSDCHFLATHIIEHFLGADWIEKHLIAEPSAYFAIKSGTGDMRDLHMWKVKMFGESLFNLQEQEGFQRVLNQLREAGRGENVEGALAELEIGGILKRSGRPFLFVENTGVKGADYDLEIRFDSHTLLADTKRKIEISDFTESGFKNTLSSARKQFPQGGQALIFVRLPEHWLRGTPEDHESYNFLGDHLKTLEGIARSFLNGTSRVVGVVLVTEFIQLYPKSISSFIVTREIWSTKLHLLNPSLIPASVTFQGDSNPNWIGLPALLRHHLALQHPSLTHPYFPQVNRVTNTARNFRHRFRQ